MEIEDLLKLKFGQPNEELYRVENVLAEPVQSYRTLPTVIFYHLGRTGGSSMAEVFTKSALSNGQLTLMTLGDQSVRESNFSQLDAVARNKYRLIHGHETHGLYNYIDNDLTHITLLRDPVLRFLSQFNNMTQPDFADHPRHGIFHGWDLDQWIDYCAETHRTGKTERRTALQAHWIVRFETGTYEGPSSPEELQQSAEKVLEKNFSFVAITEMFEQSVFLACDMFGWDFAPVWARRRAISGRANPDDLSPDIMERVRKIVEPDLIVYDAHRTKLNKLFAAAKFGSEFDRYVADTKSGRENIRRNSTELTFNRLHQLEADNKHLARENEELRKQNRQLHKKIEEAGNS
jgi:hypothetical protein